MLTVKNYKLLHRSVLTDLIQKKRENCMEYSSLIFEEDLESELIKAGFFDKFSKNIWWRQEFDHFNRKNTYRPDNNVDYE